VGMPWLLRELANEEKSSLPVRKPGTITAARILGSDGRFQLVPTFALSADADDFSSSRIFSVARVLFQECRGNGIGDERSSTGGIEVLLSFLLGSDEIDTNKDDRPLDSILAEGLADGKKENTVGREGRTAI